LSVNDFSALVIRESVIWLKATDNAKPNTNFGGSKWDVFAIGLCCMVLLPVNDFSTLVIRDFVIQLKATDNAQDIPKKFIPRILLNLP